MIPKIRVIKFGGSLLDTDRPFERVPPWLCAQPTMHNVWIVGGGKLVNALRERHTQSMLDERESHWLAIDLLTVTANILAKQFPQWSVQRSMSKLQTLCAQQPPSNTIFSCGNWLRTQSYVPESWDVTSDSIAARVSIALDAIELVLLKSVAPPSLCSDEATHLQQLSQSGYVDKWFPKAASSLEKLRLVNFREVSFAETTLDLRSH